MAAESSLSSGNTNRPAASRLTTILLVLLGVCCLISISVNMLHGDTFVHHHPDMAIARAMKDFKGGRPRRWKPKDSKESFQKDANEKSEVLNVDQGQEDTGDESTEHHNPHSKHHKEHVANREEEEEKIKQSDEEEGEKDEGSNEEVEEGETDEKEAGASEEMEVNEGEKDKEETDEEESELKDEQKIKVDEEETVEREANEEEVDETGEREVQEKADEQESEDMMEDEEIKEEEEVSSNIEPINRTPSKLGGLTCEKWGGPSGESAAEMVYWSDIPSDQDFISPFRAKLGQHKKYMTFEPGMFVCDQT